MFKEFLGGFMGKRPDVSQPPLREVGLPDDSTRVQNSFKASPRAGLGLDRGSWTPQESAQKAPEQPTPQPSEYKGNVFSLRPERHVPVDPFEAQALKTDEIGGWSGGKNPGLKEPFEEDDAAAAK